MSPQFRTFDHDALRAEVEAWEVVLDGALLDAADQFRTESGTFHETPLCRSWMRACSLARMTGLRPEGQEAQNDG